MTETLTDRPPQDSAKDLDRLITWPLAIGGMMIAWGVWMFLSYSVFSISQMMGTRSCLNMPLVYSDILVPLIGILGGIWWLWRRGSQPLLFVTTLPIALFFYRVVPEFAGTSSLRVFLPILAFFFVLFVTPMFVAYCLLRPSLNRNRLVWRSRRLRDSGFVPWYRAVGAGAVLLGSLTLLDVARKFVDMWLFHREFPDAPIVTSHVWLGATLAIWGILTVLGGLCLIRKALMTPLLAGIALRWIMNVFPWFIPSLGQGRQQGVAHVEGWALPAVLLVALLVFRPRKPIEVVQ